MASLATPIVVTGSEIGFVDDPETGLTVSSANPHSLKQAILCLRNDLASCEAMANMARECIFSRHEFGSSAKQLAKLYRGALKEKKVVTTDTAPLSCGRTDRDIHVGL